MLDHFHCDLSSQNGAFGAITQEHGPHRRLALLHSDARVRRLRTTCLFAEDVMTTINYAVVCVLFLDVVICVFWPLYVIYLNVVQR